MTTFITIPAVPYPVVINWAFIVAIESEWYQTGEMTRVTHTGGSFVTTTTPSEVLDLINAAMHPTTETETR
jgi:hypothetical protein